MERIVHIVPLGWEYDRAVLPIEALRAHKVYVLVWTEGYPDRKHYLTKFETWARTAKIEIEVVKVDSFRDLRAVMQAVSKIIVSEIAAGNRVYVNVSTSGKVAAIGATLASMAHLPPNRGMVYYVVALDYPSTKAAQREHGLARGMDGDPIPVPIFPLRLPRSDCQLVISHLARAPKHEASYLDLIECLRAGGFEPFGSRPEEGPSGRQARTKLQVAFNRRIVARLASEGLATPRSFGRSRALRLTEAGEQLAALCIDSRLQP
jgi:hypothetical protein